MLGGGGVAGIAWQTGLLAGIAERGVDLSAADAIIGTSAGAFVGSYLAGGTIVTRFAAQLEGAGDEVAAQWSAEWLTEIEAAVTAGDGDPAMFCRELGLLAQRRSVVSTETRMQVVQSRVDLQDWPERSLAVVAIDATTGEPHLVDRTAGIPIVQALAASGAVPGVWPPVTAGGRRWIDGGCVSPNNARYAAGCEVAVVIAPATQGLLPGAGCLDDEVAALRHAGTRVAVVRPDERATAAIGDNPFDSSVRRAAALTGHEQGMEVGDMLKPVWPDAGG